MKKAVYLDLMEKVLSAYSDQRIKTYTETVKKNGLEEHGYPRLTVNIGVLVAYGRKPEYKELFKEMMDLCCAEIPTAYTRNGWNVGNDFSVKEVVMCLLEVEKAEIFDKEVTDGWRKALATIDPYRTYSVIASRPPARINNWAAFTAASEQLRKFAGIGDESAFIDNQIKSQFFSFDENGMYRDPHEPMVYDFVTRLQLAAALYFGYDGQWRDDLENEMLKAADITLEMQSVTGEIPFGGRSHQFLHNETHYAALCEYYADLFKKRGDTERAGKFKSAARLATEYTATWLEGDEIHHIKNYYDLDSRFGCEGYGYFDKYMITAGSWLFLSFVMADEDIEEVDCPAISTNGICQTSEYFHKVMCRYGEYCVQFETEANFHYDANGIGRIHRAGVPSSLCLSVPFPSGDGYEIDIENPSPFAICAGVKTENGYSYSCNEGTQYELVEKEVNDKYVRVRFDCKTAEGIAVCQECIISDNGVEVRAEGEGEVRILFPVFDFDGQHKTEISASEKDVKIEYRGCACVYSTDGVITDLNELYANRNGHYKGMATTAQNQVSLKIKLYGKGEI